MYLTDLCIVFSASIFTVQYRGLCHWKAFRTLGHPGLSQEKKGREKDEQEGEKYTQWWRLGGGGSKMQ